ncbi:hypothetical protein HAX54_012787 [Datura stramonium]|uniref:Uncharacterized protein n=1 Tax=Datura stramonium TaxID=4076 RepID=A0ABS8TKB5_DATST|nr:hypothetical protein [Datura stramonium]
MTNEKERDKMENYCQGYQENISSEDIIVHGEREEAENDNQWERATAENDYPTEREAYEAVRTYHILSWEVQQHQKSEIEEVTSADAAAQQSSDAEKGDITNVSDLEKVESTYPDQVGQMSYHGQSKVQAQQCSVIVKREGGEEYIKRQRRGGAVKLGLPTDQISRVLGRIEVEAAVK